MAQATTVLPDLVFADPGCVPDDGLRPFSGRLVFNSHLASVDSDPQANAHAQPDRYADGHLDTGSYANADLDADADLDAQATRVAVYANCDAYAYTYPYADASLDDRGHAPAGLSRQRDRDRERAGARLQL